MKNCNVCLFKPGFSPSNLYFSLEEGASSISVSKTAGFLMIINRIHGCPVFMSSAQIAYRHARCRNIWNFTLCTTPLVFNVGQSAAQAFLHNTVSADLKIDKINQYPAGFRTRITYTNYLFSILKSSTATCDLIDSFISKTTNVLNFS